MSDHAVGTCLGQGMRLAAADQFVTARFQRQHRKCTQCVHLVFGARENQPVATPGRRVERPVQHFDEQLARHVQQAVQVAMLARVGARLAGGDLAQQALLNFGIEARLTMP